MAAATSPSLALSIGSGDRHPLHRAIAAGTLAHETKNARKTNLRAFLCTETVQREAPHGPPGGHFRAEEVNPEISCVHGLGACRTT